MLVGKNKMMTFTELMQASGLGKISHIHIGLAYESCQDWWVFRSNKGIS